MPLPRIRHRFRRVQHVVPSPVEGRNRHAFVVQHFLVHYRAVDITLLRDAVHFAVDDELVLQDRIHLILFLVTVEQLGNVGRPAFFGQELAFRRVSVEQRRRFVRAHLDADFVRVVLPVALHDFDVRIFFVEAFDFVVFKRALLHVVRRRVVNADRDLLGGAIVRRGVAAVGRGGVGAVIGRFRAAIVAPPLAARALPALPPLFPFPLLLPQAANTHSCIRWKT